MKRGKTKRIAASLSVLFLLLGMVLLFSTATGAGASAPAGWVIQFTFTPDNLNAISVIDANTAWATASGNSYSGIPGTVLTTIDGGANWTAQFLPPEITEVKALSAVDANVAFLTGGSYGSGGSPFIVWKTINGGAEWTPLDMGTSQNIYGVSAIDANTAWAGGQGGTILKTTNGGSSWTAQVSGTTETVDQIYAVNASVVWTGGYGKSLKTSDGGATWKDLHVSSSSLSPLDDQNAWAIDIGRIMKTSDGGTTWTEQASGNLRAISAVNATTAYAVCFDGQIAKTADGINWFTQVSPSDAALVAVGVADADTAWALGDRGLIIKTVDGGGVAQPPEISSLAPTAGMDRQTIVINGSHLGLGRGSSYVSFGSVQATQYTYWSDTLIYCKVPVIPAGPAEVKVNVLGTASNGMPFTVTEPPANGWYFQDSGTTNTLNVVRAVNADTAWAIGPGGTILKTTNGGTAWVPQVSGTSNTIVDISAVNSDIAFAIGYGYEDSTGTFAFFLKTTNGGATWTYQAFVSSMLIRVSKVTAADATNIWVAGFGANGPTYLKSSDSGSTWTVLNTGIEGNGHFDTYGFRAIDTNNVWAVGGMRSTDDSQGFVINTTDGGTNWSMKYFGPIFWYDVSTIGTQDVWIMGNQYFRYPPINGFVCSRSTDGGSSWSDVPLGNSMPREIEAVDSNTLWTAEGGRIRKTIDGGTNWIAQTDFVLDNIFDLSAFNKDVAWAVGAYGSIVHTTGGGLAAAPTVTSVAPSEGSQLSFGTNVTIEGSGFLPGAGVRLEKGGATGEATNVNVVSASQITCSVFLFGSEPGAYDVVVKNPDGQEARLAGGFTVTSQCGSGSGAAGLMLGLTLGLLSLAGCGSLRKRRRVKA